MDTSLQLAGLWERFFSDKMLLAEYHLSHLDPDEPGFADKATFYRGLLEGSSKRAEEWAKAKRGASTQVKNDLLPKIIEILESQDDIADALKGLK